MKMKFLIAIAAVPLFIGTNASVANAATNDVVVTNAWVKASEYSDHVAGMTGVFAKITNKTSKTITLVGGSSSFAPMIEVHQVVDGVMSKKDGGIKIAPGKSAILQPGGLHVMLMNLKKKILPGTVVDLKLTFKGTFGSAKSKTVTLKKMIAKTADSGAESYSPAPMPSN
jgi:copper(I)-binding protein